ncbi:anosmin-1 isoform X2 [Strongylocentrotus purpuratus]|uniref:Anosmin-1 n=1 Tax=Strongylocentrotus purpuratus TaxID=7668 RepID=A0A7M7NL57_STRPU|nr:anosmin-1 isoform X2 [Strongylocentrotus purpuratus]
MQHRTTYQLSLLWTVTFLMPIFGDGNTISARCHSTCLSAHVTSSALHTNGTGSYSLLEECSSNINCSSCIYPCKKSHKSLDTCKAKCQTQMEAVSAPDICVASCNFIKFIKNAKIGVCPSTFGGFAEACVNECEDDQGCNGEKKCCDNGCGRTCQVPNIRKKDYPSRVERRWATITENEDGDSATVRWRAVPNLTDSGFVLYAVQAKNLSQTRSQVSWYDVGVTEETEISVPLQVGRNYEFRIASVNENGTLGYFRPTAEFCLSREPERPSPPFSIETGPVQVINEKIHMNLHWSPPRYSDLPISRYRVFYSERRAVTPSIIAVKEHRLDVPGSETTCVLPDLLPGMKYYVQVKAIARYHDNRLSSDRESTYIFTPTPASNDGTGGKLTQTYVHPEVTAPSGKMPGPPGDLTHDQPYWDNGTLKVRLRWQKPKGFEAIIERFTIHWEATVCSSERGQQEGEATSLETSFELYGLSFDCTYEVWVRPVYDHGWGPFDATIQILTPPCTEVVYRGPRPTCPTPIPDIPSAPINMSYSYVIGETVSANFTWAPPTRSQYPLSGYRIYWAQVKPSSGLPEAALPTIEREEFTSTLLRETRRWYVIRNLTAGARYVVKLQALSSIGGGANVAVDIQTPDIKIQVNPVLPSEKAQTPDSNLNQEPVSPQENCAAERLVGSFLFLTILSILCTCHVIQR